MTFLVIALYILGAYMTTMFFFAMEAQRNIWLALMILFWPLPAALMLIAGVLERISDWEMGS